MFRRLSILMIPCAFVLGTLLLFMGLERHREPDWQRELRAHFSSAAIEQAARAHRPWNYTRDLTYPVASYGNFAYAVSDASGAMQTRQLALPYPPRNVKCVLIDQGARRQILFVNLYADTLWQREWLVHVGPTAPFDATLRDVIERLDCPLSL